MTFQHGKIWELPTTKCAQSTVDNRRVHLLSPVPHKNEVSAWTMHCALYKFSYSIFHSWETPSGSGMDHVRRMILPTLNLWETPLLLKLLLQLFPRVSLKYLRQQMLPRFNTKIATKLFSTQESCCLIALPQNWEKKKEKKEWEWEKRETCI